MDELFTEVNAHLQELDASYRQLAREIDQMKTDNAAALKALQKASERQDRHLDMLRKSVSMAQAATTALGGTFVSIEMHMKQQAERDAETRAEIATIKQRLDALEQRPPAA